VLTTAALLRFTPAANEINNITVYRADREGWMPIIRGYMVLKVRPSGTRQRINTIDYWSITLNTNRATEIFLTFSNTYDLIILSFASLSQPSTSHMSSDLYFMQA
jgi:hypothetical protein